MTSADLIALSAAVEPWLTIAVASTLVVLVSDAWLTGDGPAPAPSLEAPMPARRERALLLVILAVAIVTRVVGWDAAVTPAFWFSEVSTLYVDWWRQSGTLWATWVQRLHETQTMHPHESPIVLPVLAGLQWMLGARFGLPTLSGAVFGTLAVWLAWWLGRRARSQAFGLVFAALVACSPLAITWSRLSGLCTAATAHVLVAMVVGYEAGRRQSVVLAVVTGAIAWGSVYEHHSARVAIPLALAAILAGGQRRWMLLRGVLLALVASATFAAIFHWLHGATTLRALWPGYGSYPGNKGERTLVEFVSRNLDTFLTELRHTVERYVEIRRTGWDGDVWTPGLPNGGLALLPVACLGLVGLARVSARIRREWLWLALGACGLALPTLSVMTARRALVFDLAWCAFAADGLLALADGLGRRASRAVRAGAVATVLALLALWSGAAVFGLGAALPARYGVHIPFGDAGFGDGVACRRCLEAARGWQRDIADGAFVVLFDNDGFRENRTSPGGLRAYGKIASLAAGRRGSFVEMYPLMSDWDAEPPVMGPIFDRQRTTFADELAARIVRAAPQRIVWHFERGTAWEHWFAKRLVLAGGVLDTFPTALSPHRGLRVTTPWERRAEAFAAVRELALGLGPQPRACFTLAEAGATGGGPVFVLATGDAGIDRAPEWLAVSWVAHRYRSNTIMVPNPIGADVSPTAGASQRIELFDRTGAVTLVELPSLVQRHLPPKLPAKPNHEYGLGCAARVDGHWWVVDPLDGRLTSSHPAVGAVPPSAWIGVAAGAAGELVLASANQMILVFDPARRMEVARFPARVPPTVRLVVDECTPIAVGSEWIGIANLRTTVLSLYSRRGQDLGTTRLQWHALLPAGLMSLGGAGNHLAVSDESSVRTFAVRVDPSCAGE